MHLQDVTATVGDCNHDIISARLDPMGSSLILVDASGIIKAVDLATNSFRLFRLFLDDAIADVRPFLTAWPMPMQRHGILFALRHSPDIFHSACGESITDRFKVFTLGQLTASCTSLAMHADSWMAFSGCDDGTVTLWDVQAAVTTPRRNTASVWSTRAHRVAVCCVAFCGAGNVASADQEFVLVVSKTLDGTEVHRLLGESSPTVSVMELRQGHYMASITEDGVLTVWDIRAGVTDNTMRDVTDEVVVAASVSLQCFAVGTVSGHCSLYSATSMEHLVTYAIGSRVVLCDCDTLAGELLVVDILGHVWRWPIGHLFPLPPQADGPEEDTIEPSGEDTQGEMDPVSTSPPVPIAHLRSPSERTIIAVREGYVGPADAATPPGTSVPASEIAVQVMQSLPSPEERAEASSHEEQGREKAKEIEERLNMEPPTPTRLMSHTPERSPPQPSSKSQKEKFAVFKQVDAVSAPSMDPRRTESIRQQLQSTGRERPTERNTSELLSKAYADERDKVFNGASITPEIWEIYEMQHPIQGVKYRPSDTVLKMPVREPSPPAQTTQWMTTEGKVPKAVNKSWIERQQTLKPDVFDHGCTHVVPQVPQAPPPPLPRCDHPDYSLDSLVQYGENPVLPVTHSMW